MKKTTLFILAALIVNAAYAQKLPKIQTVSVRAPANIKIDGKTIEWNGQFKAHNSGQHIYYTISNDDTNLYLTARMEDLLGSRKILKGGLTFAILPPSKQGEELSITFPAIDKAVMDTEQPGGTPLLRYNTLKAKPKTTANKVKIDSLIASANRELTRSYKHIYVTGMPGMTDSLISIYNTQNIVVGATYDKNMNYTYELAIPLKYLQAAVDDAKSIKYEIRLNTVSPRTLKRAMAMRPNVIAVAGSFHPGSLDDQFIFQNTAFSGKYILAK